MLSDVLPSGLSFSVSLKFSALTCFLASLLLLPSFNCPLFLHFWDISYFSFMCGTVTSNTATTIPTTITAPIPTSIELVTKYSTEYGKLKPGVGATLNINISYR